MILFVSGLNNGLLQAVHIQDVQSVSGEGVMKAIKMDAKVTKHA